MSYAQLFSCFIKPIESKVILLALLVCFYGLYLVYTGDWHGGAKLTLVACAISNAALAVRMIRDSWARDNH